jgi:23S rRNA (uracil1939-C5)-methyltransferase
VRARHLVAGGAALAHDPDGRVVLVEGALPGELVVVGDVERRERLITGTVATVVEASPHRITPSCPMVAKGCGGCDLQHADPAGQPDMKVAIVADALRHLGRLSDAVVVAGPPLARGGFRTTVRAVIDPTGRAGFRRARSHDPVVPAHCEVAHPLADAILADGRFPGASEVTIRVGVASGDQLVVVAVGDTSTSDEVLATVEVPTGVAVAGPDGTAGGVMLSLREQVAGRWWRISAPSFFQTRPDGAEALASVVASQVARLRSAGADGEGLLVDAYAGVGLFAGVMRDQGWGGPITAVERAGSSTTDARHNLAGDDVVVVASAVERWSPAQASIVVADPARSGLGRKAVDVLVATNATGIVLVSCDAASLGRDAALLASHGFTHRGSEVIDVFTHTHHVEVVTTFSR